jgi:hypothetical protein
MIQPPYWSELKSLWLNMNHLSLCHEALTLHGITPSQNQ